MKNKVKRGGIYKTSNGTFRARAMVNGLKFDSTFKLKKNAIDFLNKINSTTIKTTKS